MVGIKYLGGNKINRVILLLILFISSYSLKGQEYQYHKIYIYNFTKYIQWPTDRQSGNFIIGVVGKSSMADELISLAKNRTVGNQKIVIKEINNPSDGLDCHIIFVPRNKSNHLAALTEKISGKPTLVITEKEGMALQGSAINFVFVDGKLKYELNKALIDKAGLKVMPDLVKLAILVNS